MACADVLLGHAVQAPEWATDRAAVRRVKKREAASPGQAAEEHGLTRDEDDELRRLHYFSHFGALAGQKLERFLELRLRDRRRAVRTPREFELVDKRNVDGAEGQAVSRPHPNLWLR